jgi:hypothetical protein
MSFQEVHCNAAENSVCGEAVQTNLWNEIVPSEDAYFSVDVETDGPIPGRFSMLSFAIVYAGSFDGLTFREPTNFSDVFYRELQPISDAFEQEALDINKLDRSKLVIGGTDPRAAMNAASEWIKTRAGKKRPVLVAYPVSFDWTWLYWYFVAFSDNGSPFGHSRCFDIKTAVAVKGKIPLSLASRSRLPPMLQSDRPHTHHAIDDAIEQAEIFASVFKWSHGNESN